MRLNTVALSVLRPEFAKSHLRSSHKHQILILNHTTLTTGLGSLDFDSIEKKPSLLNSPFPGHCYCLNFLGSCNGLVASSIFRCITKERLFIWNPSTGFFTQLPSRGNIVEKQIDVIFGFGYLSDLDKEEISMMTKVPVAAFRTQVGKRDSMSYKLGVTREGCLYVMVPSLVRDCGECAYYLVDFWVMKEYGNSDSWSRTLGVKIYSEHAVRPEWYISLEAILVSETSAFVRNTAAVKEQLISTIYHPKDGSSRIYILDNYVQNMVVYEESLICCLD